MSSDARQPIPYSEAPDYFGLDTAISYAENFRVGAPLAYAKDDRWAKYRLSSTLDILTTLLQTNIYTVIAYPPAGFEVALVSDIEDKETFRGWILQYDPVHSQWSCLVRSQEVGIAEFKRLRREYKAE